MCMGNGSVAPIFLTSPPDGGEWSPFCLWGIAHGDHYIGGWRGSRAQNQTPTPWQSSP
jgi:hypothetical protein